MTTSYLHGQLLVSPQVGIHTTEAGGTAMFTVALTAEPLDEVVVELTSMNIAEGTVSPRQIVFSRRDYDEPHTVTITGVDDQRADGNASYTIRVSSARLTAVDVEVTNDDDDVAGFVVAPASGLVTSEAGLAATFNVQLTSQPTADVTIPISSSDTTEGIPSTGELAFTSDDWAMPKPVVITGANDTVRDGNVDYSILLGPATSTDTVYDRLDPDDVHLTNLDDGDLQGNIVVSPLSIQTGEDGRQATFTVVLAAASASDVAIGIASSDMTEARVSKNQLVFTSTNWNIPQTVTVTGLDDFVVEWQPAILHHCRTCGQRRSRLQRGRSSGRLGHQPGQRSGGIHGAPAVASNE